MSDRLLTFDLLFAFLAFTLAMTYWASRATRTAADFYVIGTLLSFAVIQALVAEPFRNAGTYTMADAPVPRLRERPVRLAMATSTIAVAIIYMVAQIIGAGVLARLLLPIRGTLFGMPPETLAIVVVGL